MCMAYGSLLTILEHTVVAVVVAGVITIILMKIKNKKTTTMTHFSYSVHGIYMAVYLQYLNIL